MGCTSVEDAKEEYEQDTTVTAEPVPAPSPAAPSINGWIEEVGYPTFMENLGNDPDLHFHLEEVEGGVLLTICYDGLVDSLYEVNFEGWEEIESTFCELSETGYYSLVAYGIDHAQCNFVINLENDLNPDKVILSIMNGEIIYSISED